MKSLWYLVLFCQLEKLPFCPWNYDLPVLTINNSDSEHHFRQSFSSAIRAVQRVVQREARVRLRPLADGGVHGLVAVGAEPHVERLAAAWKKQTNRIGTKWKRWNGLGFTEGCHDEWQCVFFVSLLEERLSTANYSDWLCRNRSCRQEKESH